MSSVDRRVGFQIQVQRGRAGRTQRELAAAIGVTRQLISAYEGGRTGILVSRLFAVAGFLGCPIECLLTEATERESVK